MRDEPFDVWITKYALTRGVYKTKGRPASFPDVIRTGETFCESQSFIAKDWHRDEASAKARAEEMRIAKIQSLGRQIARLQELEF